MPIETDTAANRDPTKNTAHATNKTGFLPQISENFPHVGTLAAFASRYAEPIQV